MTAHLVDKDMSHAFYILAEEMRQDSEFWFPELHNNARVGLHYALGLAGEVGELLNIIKKANRKSPDQPMHPAYLDTEAAGREVADIFIYLVDLAHELGINVWDAFEQKHAELEERWGKRPA